MARAPRPGSTRLPWLSMNAHAWQRSTVVNQQTLDAAPSGTPLLPLKERAPSFAPDELAAGRYRILAPLGEGGMGQVFRVVDALHPERPVALKTLSRLQLAGRVELL